MVIGRVVVWVPSEADRVEGRAREEVPPDWRERDMVRRRVGRGRERMVDVVGAEGSSSSSSSCCVRFDSASNEVGII